MVTLGRSGVKVTRLAFGTGSFSGQVQRALGQDEFTRLVRHAYDRGAMVILKGASDDLRRRGRAAIDQDDDGLSVRDVTAMRVVALRIFGVAAACRNHFARRQQIVGNLDSLVQQSTGIVAQVEHITLQSRTDLALEIAHRQMTSLALAALIVAIVGLIFFSAIFSGLETALFALRPGRDG